MVDYLLCFLALLLIAILLPSLGFLSRLIRLDLSLTETTFGIIEGAFMFDALTFRAFFSSDYPTLSLVYLYFLQLFHSLYFPLRS